MRTLSLLLCFLSFLSFAQEKRLALVIGNANYENAPLKNPVNDAILMKETFEKLGFDVILDTNIATRKDFLETIDKFQKERENYNVGFVYYAGHAVQIDGINYMLPTKEKYESISNVKYNGLEVGIFMDQYMDPIENEINVLILDACRNNPFEKNWSGSARSLANGSGLAEIKNAPSGSLIAFSTAAGATALDGNGNEKNSTYCLSLAKNMQLENTDISKVFGIVRKEVRESIGQFPAVYDQLEGNDFYLKKSTFTDQIIEIDSLIIENKYGQALNSASEILALDKTNKAALLRKARCRYSLEAEKYDLAELFHAQRLYPEDGEVYFYFARYYNKIKNGEKAIEAINKAIELDSLNSEYFDIRGLINSELLKDNDAALKDYNNAIRLSPLNSEYYESRAWFYADYTEDMTKAFDDINKGINLNPEDPNLYYVRGTFYDDYTNQNDLALRDYNKIQELNPKYVHAYNSKGLLLSEEEKYDLAILEFNKGISFEYLSPLEVAYCYANRALVYSKQGKLDKAIADYNKSIELDPNNGYRYYDRALYFADYKDDYTNALFDINNSIKLSPNNPDFYFQRALIYKNHLENDKAIEDFNQVLLLDPNDIDAINWVGVIYGESKQNNLAIEFYEKGIEKAEENPVSAAFCYRNRGEIFKEQGRFQEAENDYTKAIELDPTNPERYLDRSLFYFYSLNDVQKALKDVNIAIIDLGIQEAKYFYFRGIYYAPYLKKDALKDFEKALELDPEDFDVIIEIGSLYEEEEKWDLAIEIYEKGITLESTNPVGAASCYNARGLVFASKGKLIEALSDLNKSIDLDPNNSSLYYNRGNYFLDYENDIHKSLADYNKAIELSPNDLDFIFARSLLYKVDFEINDKALSDWERMLQIDSLNIDAINAMGVFYEEEGKWDLAIQQYDKGINLKDVNPTTAALCHANKAYILSQQNKLQEAKKNYSMAIYLDLKNPDYLFKRANFYLDYLEEYENAEDDYTEALKIDPQNIDIYYARGILYDDYLNNNKKALLDYEKILEIDSLNIDAINAIGLIYEEEEKWDLALEQYEKGIQLEDLNNKAASFCYTNRASLYVKKENLEYALLDYNKAIELDPLSGIKYYNRGDFFENVKNDYNRALLDYSMAIYLEPENLNFLHDRGLFYKKISENEKAKEDLLKTLEIDSTYSLSFNSLGTIYDQEGDIEKALEYYQRGIESEGVDQNNKAFCYSNKGSIKSSLGHLEEAEIAYNGAILAEPENSEWHSDMALFHCNYSGKYQESLRNINQAIKLEPKVASYYITRSYIYFLLNDKKSQFKDINTAIELEPDVPNWYIERGLYYEQNGEIENAINDFDLSFTLDSTYNLSLIYKAKTQMKSNEYESAINTLNSVIEVDPNDPEPYFLKGRIYMNMNDTIKAIMYYSLSQGKLENYDYYISDNLGFEMNRGEYYVIIGDFFSNLGKKEIMCEYYNKASISLSDEYLFRYQVFKKNLQEKLNQYCNQ